MSGFGYGFSPVFARSHNGYDPVAAAYFAAVPNAFDSARKTIINTLIAGLRADGNLTKLDRLWLFANTTTGNAVIDLIGLNSATLVNAPAFVADQGYTGDGATSYINSNYNLSTNGVNYTLNNGSLGIYIINNINEVAYDIGVNDGTAYSIIGTRLANTIDYIVNDGTDVTTAIGSSAGFTTARRTASNAVAAFKNGVSVSTAANASISVPALNSFIGCRNAVGTPLNFSTKQISIVFWGSGTIDQVALFTRIEAYMDALGTGVV